ncbi:MAG TPA: Na+/H+ antiporter subunit E, partial [Clostridiales bacterium]|nr:Na+/H+ antiporter subunit E [Clostridiales bacterium]
MYTISKILIYFVFWMCLSETIHLETILVGVGICIVIHFMHTHNESRVRFQRGYYFLLYGLVLLKEVIKANFMVAKIVLSPQMKISPCMVRVETKLKSDFCKTILANSITLTPGTLVVLADEQGLLVHCLKKEYAKSLENSE